MKSSLIFPFVKRRVGLGFTLVEILVAMVVLSILILMLAQIFGMVNGFWLYGQGKVNNFTKGRAMLNILQNDLRSAICRPDLAVFSTTQAPTSGGPSPVRTLEFYTERAGVPGKSGFLRNVSLVQYALINGTTNGLPTSTLQRSDMPLFWTDPATYLAFGNPSGFLSTATGATTGTLTPRDTVPGALAFQIVFVQSDGSFSTTTFTPAFAISGIPNANPTRSIGIALAVADDEAMKLLGASQITNLQTGFVSALSTQTSPSVKACWEQYLNTGLTWSSYPKHLSTGIGIYESYISIP